MKYIPAEVTQKIGRLALKTRVHSPTILFGVGVVGFVSTVVMASRATLRVDEVLDEVQTKVASSRELFGEGHLDYTFNEHRQDMIVLYARGAKDLAKLYAPTILIGALTIGCFTGAHQILTRRNVALTAAYAAIDQAFKEYRDRVVEEHGVSSDWHYKHGSEIVTDEVNGKKVKHVGPSTPSQYARFFDELCLPWRRGNHDLNLIYLRSQQNYANDLLRSRGHVFLNEVYDMIGVDRTKAGAVVGWVLGAGDDFVDFGVFDGDNPHARDFVNGREGAILLDFNVDGIIYDKI